VTLMGESAGAMAAVLHTVSPFSRGTFHRGACPYINKYLYTTYEDLITPQFILPTSFCGIRHFFGSGS
jgi:hypothetical protein